MGSSRLSARLRRRVALVDRSAERRAHVAGGLIGEDLEGAGFETVQDQSDDVGGRGFRRVDPRWPCR
jgi:hypothetical protein